MIRSVNFYRFFSYFQRETIPLSSVWTSHNFHVRYLHYTKWTVNRTVPISYLLLSHKVIFFFFWSIFNPFLFLRCAIFHIGLFFFVLLKHTSLGYFFGSFSDLFFHHLNWYIFSLMYLFAKLFLFLLGSRHIIFQFFNSVTYSKTVIIYVIFDKFYVFLTSVQLSKIKFLY